MDKNEKIFIRPPSFLLGSYLSPDAVNNELFTREIHNENNNSTNKPTNKLTNKPTNKYWDKIKKLLKTVSLNKYVLITTLDFLHKCKYHINNLLIIDNINKLEYFSILEHIDNLFEQVNDIIKILRKKNIYFFDVIWSQGNIECITNIYIQILYLIEKYGIESIVYSINLYLLLYTSLQDIYYIWQNEYYNFENIIQFFLLQKIFLLLELLKQQYFYFVLSVRA